MLDSGGTEGGSPQLMQALQAQQQAQSGHGSGGAGMPGLGGLSSGASNHVGGHGMPGGTPSAAPPRATPPREVGSITEELVTRPLQDIGDVVKSGFNVNEWFGIKNTDTPEQQQRNQELHARYQQLTGEQQQRFQARLQREQQRKSQMAQEDNARAERKRAEAASTIVMPTGPQRGEQKPKSQTQQMTNNRQNFNKVQSSG